MQERRIDGRRERERERSFPIEVEVMLKEAQGREKAGKETIKVSGNKYRSLKFHPVIQEGRIFEKEEDLNVWVTDDENKIPLLAQAKVMIGSIKMELTDYKGLANPISKVE